MASFTLRAGAFGGVASSCSVARERGGAFGVDLVLVLLDGDGCAGEEPEGFALEEIVRVRADGDFGTRRVEDEAVKSVEGSVTRGLTR